jgi:hypothetical protein
MSSVAESIRFFGYLALEAGEFLVYYWPVSVAVLVVGFVGFAARWHLRNPPIREHLLLLTIPYLMPLAVLLAGTLLRYDGPPHPNWREPPAWRGWVLFALVILNVILMAVAIVIMKRARVRSVAAFLPALWLSLCAYLPSGFAVAGVAP